MQSDSRLWIGLGFQRGASPALIAAAIHQVCLAHGFNEALIIGLATLDSKAASLLDLCAERQWMLRGFSAQQLRAVPTPNPAAQVMATVATPSVAEAAAILAAGSPLCLCKQIIRQSGEPAVTLAVAQSRPNRH
ncbi:MAG: cobalamin biosynthesis protein [Pegethrix bostrychoides GSE-TBD4-15B]|jgi:cobalt-precorrin 5A hydrolase/precorrin-3B C17-methyltransferase|uniref:Cobalamin biosynthesis protein n=1 Tax=Pegethrix bostrychoides GSE-TBD4-15B TaxID=2839662 RepID=A0A951PBQ1_9CYAN|nr:cobalamin biosynthesis protein [Pegethrix bostrychoides GSE-TBD4-15B]